MVETETSQLTYFLAVAVVGISLTLLGFFLGKTFVASNFFKKGVALYKQKDYAGAEAAFLQVIQRHRTNDMARLLLGNALMAQDKIDEATPIFRELIERSPKNVDAYLRLGDTLMKQDKIEEAIAVLQKARNLYKAGTTEQQQLDQLIQEMGTRK
jgi:TolA-binding protein